MLSKGLIVLAIAAFVLGVTAEESNIQAVPNNGNTVSTPNDSLQQPSSNADTLTTRQNNGNGVDGTSNDSDQNDSGPISESKSWSKSVSVEDGKVVDQHSSGQTMRNSGGKITKTSYDN